MSHLDIRSILKMIERDVNFLQKNNLMDYSLLIGIEAITQYNEHEERSMHKLNSSFTSG